MNRILFIVEGEHDEITYIDRLFNVCNPLQKYTIFPYKTNLHNLAKFMFAGEEIDDSLDIREVLKEHESNPDLKNELSQDFSDIILVFDFEPQQDFPRFELIRKMLQYFNNSTENGKLYINYPIMQAYRHFSHLPDDSFRDVIVRKEEFNHYKAIVDSISIYKNTSHHSYSLFVSMAVHQLRKLNFILNGKYELPNIAYVNTWKQEELFDVQLNNLYISNWIFVIHTFSLFLIEYNPTTFYNEITKHAGKYSI